MRAITGMLFLLLIKINAATAGPVYRCIDPGGESRFTDRACPGRGEQLEESALQPNLMASTATSADHNSLDESTQFAETAARKRGGCNNSADLRHIDLMLKSLTSDKRQKRFLKAERKRVMKCELDNLPVGERRQRDAALRRTRSLRESEREAAEVEIEGLYAAQRPAKRAGKR